MAKKNAETDTFVKRMLPAEIWQCHLTGYVQEKIRQADHFMDIFCRKSSKSLSNIAHLETPRLLDFSLNKVRASTCFCPSFWVFSVDLLGVICQQCLDVASICMDINWPKRGSITFERGCDSKEKFSCWSFDENKKWSDRILYGMIESNRKSTRHLFEIQTCFSGQLREFRRQCKLLYAQSVQKLSVFGLKSR